MKSCSILFFSLVFFFFSSLKVQAIQDPLAVLNNRFGIHIVDENDLEKASELVNSSGGDWGYVTLVIREDDRDLVKWQRIFDQMRRLRLIPLLRLATVPEGSAWKAPKPEDAPSWAEFLDSLNWVVKNRYVILFNEPNHAKEWGGEIKPAEFAQIISSFSKSLKEKSADFFILPGAVDPASTDSTETMSASQYYKWMQAENPDVFSFYDGLVSHSYPHPDFVGPVTGQGRGSITAYRWEQSYLKELGLKSPLPVFVTETGWAHTGSLPMVKPAIRFDLLSDSFKRAFTQVWIDSNLVAVTPFILNYQDKPFAQFSWLKPGGNEVFPHFDTVKSIPKTSGQPLQHVSFELVGEPVPQKLITDSAYHLSLTLKNTGQSIYDPSTDSFLVTSPLLKDGQVTLPLNPTEPDNTVTLTVFLKTPTLSGPVPFTYALNHNGQPVAEPVVETISIIDPPSLLVKAKLWLKKVSTGSDFTLLIYDGGDLVKKIDSFGLENGIGQLKEIRDVIPNRHYRFVITKPYYLPRQTIENLNPAQTEISFARLLPFDFYPDGQFTLKDLIYSLRYPLNTISLLFF